MAVRHVRKSVTHLLDIFQTEYIWYCICKSSVNSLNNCEAACLAEFFFSITDELVILLYGFLCIYTKHMYYLNYTKITKLQNSLMLLLVFNSMVYTYKYKVLDAQSENKLIYVAVPQFCSPVFIPVCTLQIRHVRDLGYSISRQSLMPGGMFSMLLHLYFLTCWPKPYINYSCLWQKKSVLGIVSVATSQMPHGLLLSINCAPVFKKEPSFIHKILADSEK